MIELIFMILVSVYMVVNLVESKGLKKGQLKNEKALVEDQKVITYLCEEYVKCNNDSEKDIREKVIRYIKLWKRVPSGQDKCKMRKTLLLEQTISKKHKWLKKLLKKQQKEIEYIKMYKRRKKESKMHKTHLERIEKKGDLV